MGKVVRAENAAKPALVFAVVVLLWGSTFIAVKICLQQWSVVQVMAGRYVFGALLLLPLAIQACRENGENRASGASGAIGAFNSVSLKTHALPILHLALVGSVLPVGLMTWAQLSIPSGLAGVIASLAPMMALIAGVLFFGLPSRGLHWLGVTLGTAGMVILRWDGSSVVSGAADLPASALAAALLATVCWGLAAQNYRRHLCTLNPLHVTALSFQVMACVMLVVLATQANAPTMHSHDDWMPWLYLLCLGAFSAVAVTGYNWLIARWGAVNASSCTYVVPLVALGLGYMDAEPLSWRIAFACLLIAVAMWAVRQPVKSKL